MPHKTFDWWAVFCSISIYIIKIDLIKLSFACSRVNERMGISGYRNKPVNLEITDYGISVISYESLIAYLQLRGMYGLLTFEYCWNAQLIKADNLLKHGTFYEQCIGGG